MVVLYKFKNIKELKAHKKLKKLPHTISNIYSYQRESGDCNTVIGSRSRSSEGPRPGCQGHWKGRVPRNSMCLNFNTYFASCN